MSNKDNQEGIGNEHDGDDSFDDDSNSPVSHGRTGSMDGDEGSEDVVDFLSIKDAGQGEESRIADDVVARNIISINKSVVERATALEELRREMPDLEKRAKAIRKQKLDEFPETFTKTINGMLTVVVVSSDLNRWTAFEMLLGGKDSEERPFLNEFTGMRTDRDGAVIDGRYSVSELIKALSVLGLSGQSARTIREAFAEWALTHRRNPLTERMESMLQPWDGVERLNNSLITLFECFDTPLNRRMGWYFWTSLYVRCVHGGNNAGIVLSLFGAQNCGKSYFTTRIVREILNNPDALPTALDLAGGSVQFLRSITGNSVIANIPEMTGFTRADMNKVKSFITNSSDNFDFKFEGNQTKSRQWITVMDGNKYKGLQRDDTGNRRFYPVFCGQLEDVDGEPAWQGEPFQCDMIVSQDRRFEAYMWKCLAEAAAWIESHGLGAYNHEVGRVAAEVQEFSRAEMERGSGTVEDSLLSTYGLTALLKSQKHVWLGRGDNHGLRAVDIKPVEFHQRLQALSKRDAIPSHVDSFFSKLGAKVMLATGNKKVYRFNKWGTLEAFNHPETGFLASMGDDDGDYAASEGDAADSINSERSERNGGF